jgi:hypothetical protein
VRFTVHDVLITRGRVSTGKSQGSSGISNEFLAAVPWLVFVRIASLFADRFADLEQPSPDTWYQLLFCLFPKERHPRFFRDFCGISLCHNISKWYCALLTRVAQTWLQQHLEFQSCPQAGSLADRWRNTYTYAYENQVGCVHLAASLALLYHTGCEWQQQRPIYIYIYIC